MPRARAERPRNGPPLGYRRLVPRWCWPRAEDELRRAKAEFLVDALHDRHAVLVVTTARGAAALERFGAMTANGVHAPKAPVEPKPIDALDLALERYAADVRAGSRDGLT